MAKQAVRELHEKLVDLESGLEWHWLRTGLAKTGSAGLAVAGVACFATGFGAALGAGLGAASASVGVGATIGDYVSESWTSGGLKTAYEKAQRELTVVCQEDPGMLWQVMSIFGGVANLKTALIDAGLGAVQAAEIFSVAEKAGRVGQGVRVGGAVSRMVGYGQGGVVATETVASGGVALSNTVMTFTVVGAVLSTGVAIHSWSTDPPSLEMVKTKREEIGELLKKMS